MLPFSWSFREWCRAAVVLAVGVLLGMAIWWASPMITGHGEPWDAEGGYYFGTLFVAGFVAAIFLPKAFWVAPIGVYIGQLLFGLYFYDPEGVSLWPIGMVLAVFHCLAALGGALVCAILMWLLHLVANTYRFVRGLRKPPDVRKVAQERTE